MTETLLKYFQILKTEKLLSSQVPKALLDSTDFQNMLDSEIIMRLSVGRGYVYELNEEKRQVFENWFTKKFPNAGIEVTDRASSIAKFKDSKKSKGKSVIVFLKGNKHVQINNETIDLKEYTHKFGFFACVLESLETEKLCFVENKENFLQAEKVISQEYVFIHSYGRIGKSLLEKIQTNEVLVFSDYDYIGLNEYLKCKSVFENTSFFVPENYDLLFEKYAKEIMLNRKKGQKASKNVLASQDETVLRICQDLQTKQKFLEQESLLINL
jgi:hypothetical protein